MNIKSAGQGRHLTRRPVFVHLRRCRHEAPEPVILQSRSGKRWCVVRCAICGKRLG